MYVSGGWLDGRGEGGGGGGGNRLNEDTRSTIKYNTICRKSSHFEFR